jgi:crotonobetainyl-CoA:carnitine CoA-transferase CaiB-like acyl-CoA transferase
MDQVSGPLTGLLVADFSRVLAGPYCTMILADLGADVIKVEGPGGDDTRHWMPPVREGISTYYLSINRNKRSVQLNLRDEADRAAGRESGCDLRLHHGFRRRWRGAPARL